MVITPPPPFPLFFSFFFPTSEHTPISGNFCWWSISHTHASAHTDPNFAFHVMVYKIDYLPTSITNYLGRGGFRVVTGCPWTTIWSLYWPPHPTPPHPNVKYNWKFQWYGSEYLNELNEVHDVYKGNPMSNEIFLEYAPSPPPRPFVKHYPIRKVT
jgi:hypothetical protein